MQLSKRRKTPNKKPRLSEKVERGVSTNLIKIRPDIQMVIVRLGHHPHPRKNYIATEASTTNSRPGRGR
jgi:hypothetical protein